MNAKSDPVTGNGGGRSIGVRLRVIANESRSCILEALPNVILAVDREGVIVDANAAAEGFFEIGKPLLIGQLLTRLIPLILRWSRLSTRCARAAAPSTNTGSTSVDRV